MEAHLVKNLPTYKWVTRTQFINCATCGLAGIVTSAKLVVNCPKCGDRIGELGHDHRPSRRKAKGPQ